MALDISKVKERLQKLQSKGKGSSERIDYKKLFFKPQLGKQTIRILPNKFNADFPFAEVIYHNQNAFKKSIYSLENWGEKDPVMQLRRELYNDSDPETKEISEDTAKKLAPRTKYYAQVIVRGRESEGPLLWEMNKTTYESLLSITAQDEEYGDITDIMEGTDLVVEGYSDSILIGKRKVDYVAVNITPKRKTSPLSDNSGDVEKWLANQRNPLEIYKKYSYQEIKDLLKGWLDPETQDSTTDTETAQAPQISKAPTKAQVVEVEDDDDDEGVAPFDADEPTDKQTVKGGSASKSSKQKIAEMFDDEDE